VKIALAAKTPGEPPRTGTDACSYLRDHFSGLIEFQTFLEV
jgi:hypothetical protein